MYLALLLLICALIVLFNVWRGWRTGALAQFVTLLVLAACYGAAAYCGLRGLTAPFLSFVPRLAQPYVLGALVAMGLYAVLSLILGMALRQMDRRAAERIMLARAAAAAANGETPQPDEPVEARPITNSRANRALGGALGGAKGLVLAGLLIVVVQFLGSVAVALVPPPQPSHSVVAGRAPATEPAPTPVQSVFRQLGEEIRKTPVGNVADAVAPVKQQQIEAVGKLSKLTANPAALARMQRQPQVQALMKNRRVIALGKNPRIARAVQEQRWTDLLNEPAIVDLARDPDVQRQIQTLNLDDLTREAEQAARKKGSSGR